MKHRLFWMPGAVKWRGGVGGGVYDPQTLLCAVLNHKLHMILFTLRVTQDDFKFYPVTSTALHF